MVLFGSAGLMLMIGLRQTDWLGVAVVFCLLTIGGTFFVLGELLRRRPRLGPAYGLVAVSGTCVGACLLQFIASGFGLVPYASSFTCPCAFGFALTLPVLWHTLAAIRAMRRSPEHGELGFQVLPPVLPRAESQVPAMDPHRSDNSR
jgi:hypothetical protein